MWQTLLPIAGQLLGGLFANKSAKKAGQASAQGYQQGIDTIRGFYDDAKGYMNPYMQTGGMANGGIQSLLGGDYSGFYSSPDFQSRLKAGTDMFDSSAAARGGVFGGGATRGREMFAQDLAARGLGDYRNWLGNVAGQGQNAALGLSQMGANAGNSIANLYGAQGNARASSYGQQGANTANMIGGIAGGLSGLFGGGGFGGWGGASPSTPALPPRVIGPYS